MDAFSYLSAFLSIILGLAITQVLQGVRGVLLNRDHVRLFLPSLAFALFIVLIAIQFWWASFGLSDRAVWNFPDFAMVLLQAICVYMLAALVLPDIGPDPVDLRTHYFRNLNWLMGMLFATLVVSVLKDVTLTGSFPSSENLAFHVIFAVNVIVALIVRSPRFHAVLSLLMLSMFGVYVALLFARL